MLDATEETDSTKRLTTEQIAGFSIEFILAGYETTANTLSFTTHLLATHPDVQEKLQAEIDQYFEEEPVSYKVPKLYHLVYVYHRKLRCTKHL